MKKNSPLNKHNINSSQTDGVSNDFKASWEAYKSSQLSNGVPLDHSAVEEIDGRTPQVLSAGKAKDGEMILKGVRFERIDGHTLRKELTREEAKLLRLRSKVRELSPQFDPSYSAARSLHSKAISTLWRELMHCIVNNKPFDTSLVISFYKSYNWKELFISPLKRLPNVKHFKIIGLAPHDKTFEAHGVLKREFDPQIEWEPFKNRAINNYLAKQESRMIKSLQRGRLDLF